MSLTVGKGASALHDLLRSNSPKNLIWYEIAEAIEVAEQSSASAEEASSIRSAAVASSGFSPGLISRYVSTYARIRKIAEGGRLNVGDMLAPAFNTVEAAVKLFELDQRKGVDAFGKLKEGNLTLSMVRSELTDAKVSVAERQPTSSAISFPLGVKFLSKDVRRRRQNTIISALQRGWAPLSGQYEELSWDTKDSFLDGEGIYRVRRTNSSYPSGEEHYGLETIVMASEKGSRFIDALLPASIVRARFFLQYHLAFWSHEPVKQIEHAVELLDLLEEDTIGVISVGQDGSIVPRRKPKLHNEPRDLARRQDLLSKIMENKSLKPARKSERR